MLIDVNLAIIGQEAKIAYNACAMATNDFNQLTEIFAVRMMLPSWESLDQLQVYGLQ